MSRRKWCVLQLGTLPAEGILSEFLLPPSPPLPHWADMTAGDHWFLLSTLLMKNSLLAPSSLNPLRQLQQFRYSRSKHASWGDGWLCELSGDKRVGFCWPRETPYPCNYCIFCSQFAEHIVVTRYTVSTSDGILDLSHFLMLNNSILKFRSRHESWWC